MLEIGATTNPIFRKFPAPVPADSETAPRMTFGGAVRKTVILALWTGTCAVWIWRALCEPPPPAPRQENLFLTLLFVSALAPFGLVALSLWRKTLSPFLAPIYAMLQGVFFGFVSVALQQKYPGQIMQMVCLSLSICICLAYAYRFEFIRPANTMNRKLLFGLSGIVVYVVVAALLQYIGITVLPLLYQGPGAAFSGVIAVIASVTFITQFDLAAKSAQQNHPEYLEWHAAFGLILSVVWLYPEGLRLFVRGRIPNESQKA